ncbi:hypothetical protein TREAZ_1459 [Leadbettera azotonutricia ZAS-9]|uniref:Uncharacterized protein n=1 Tax=Leadbettera azotonutricia (strain ATCC BAA-888 / DSM 13862 / ZAS-9) TaxID=545695 RepID=F5YEQ1_LEAAZ|nr:hypothetical protein TREAZ_1459 [Leadbettera azotonutricia ZAS-9]
MLLLIIRHTVAKVNVRCGEIHKPKKGRPFSEQPSYTLR